MYSRRGPQLSAQIALKAADDARDGQVAVLGRVVGEDVEADRMSEVGGVEVADVIDARAGDAVEEALGEVAVRVEEGNPLAGLDVLQDQVLEEGRLAGAGLADGVEVLPAIGTAKAKGEWYCRPSRSARRSLSGRHRSWSRRQPTPRRARRNRPAAPAEGHASVRWGNERMVCPTLPLLTRGTAGGWLCAGTFMSCLRDTMGTKISRYAHDTSKEVFFSLDI